MAEINDDMGESWGSLADRYDSMPESDRDNLHVRLGFAIFFCTECDEKHLDDYEECPDFPKQHDRTGYVGTGTDYPEDMRRLARLIATDY